MIKTRLTELLGIRHPIVLGGMSRATGADLVAAVSQAGGLGTLGVSSMTPDEIRIAVERIRSRTERPFGLNVLMFLVDRDQIDAGLCGPLARRRPADAAHEERHHDGAVALAYS